MTTLELATYFLIAAIVGFGLLIIMVIITNPKEDDYDWWNDV